MNSIRLFHSVSYHRQKDDFLCDLQIEFLLFLIERIILIQYSLMRVTQTEKPFSFLEIRVPQKVSNDENDPLRANVQRGKCSLGTKDSRGNDENENKKMNKLRREYLKKIQEIQEKYNNQIQTLKQDHEVQKRTITAKYKKVITEKEQYIQLLQSMVNSVEPLNQTKKAKIIDQSKQIYTEHTKNHTPQYQEISDRIDFKLEPRMFEKKYSLDSKRLGQNKRFMVESFSTNNQLSSNESSRHKLIPKDKPSECKHSITASNSQIPIYKNCSGVKISRPFFV